MKYEIGCSGYSYSDWKPAFYPPHVRQDQMLAYYARFFSTVEINFTYYRMPEPKTFERMAARTPDDFTFWVKTFQDFTHKQDRRQVDAFKDALSPLRDADKLSGLLLQFPQSFHYTAANRRHLAALADDFADHNLAVEFRHRSWLRDSVDREFRRRNLTLAIVDVPPIDALFPPVYKATNKTAYLRLHSRNADNWYGDGGDRYDYNYPDAQLEEIADQLRPLFETIDRLVVFFNNCKRAAAAQNAQRLKQILGLIDKRSVPSQPPTETDLLS